MLNPTEHSANVADQVQQKFIDEFNDAMNARLVRETVTVSKFDFSTGESSSVNSSDGRRLENIIYSPTGSLPLNSSLSDKVKVKDGGGRVTSVTDQTMMLSIAESIMTAMVESLKLASVLHLQYIVNNLEVSFNIPTLSTMFNFPLPAIPAAPAPLIPIGSSITVGGSPANLVNGGIR